MLRLRYHNDLGQLVSPLLHSQIVAGYATTPDYLIINCKRSIATEKKETDYVWDLQIKQEKILNLPDVMEFLTKNKYEHVVLGKDLKPIQQPKVKAPKKDPPPTNLTLNFE